MNGLNALNMRQEPKRGAKLAEKLNYSDKSISKWERGDGRPDLKTLCKMAELFSVSLDFFVTDGASEQLKKYAAPKKEDNTPLLY